MQKKYLWILLVVGAAWAIELLNHYVLGYKLNQFGIVPHDLLGTIGIVTAPFLHRNIDHTIVNSLVFLLLALLVTREGSKRFFNVTSAVWLISGGLIWIFGKHSLYVGSGGMVCGYVAFLVVAGFLERNFITFAIALAVGVLWLLAHLGHLPVRLQDGWELQVAGLIAGAFAATMYAKRG